MPSDYSEAIKEAFATAKSDVAILDTLEISHPSLTDGSLFLVRDFSAQTLGLETGTFQEFEPAGFQIELPARDNKGIQDLSIAIDNTDRRVSDFVKRTLEFPNESIEITYRPYLSNDLSTPQMDPPLVLYVSNVSIGVSNVTATATFADVLNKTFPSEIYTKTRFPAL